jgi:hypothetical protein
MDIIELWFLEERGLPVEKLRNSCLLFSLSERRHSTLTSTSLEDTTPKNMTINSKIIGMRWSWSYSRALRRRGQKHQVLSRDSDTKNNQTNIKWLPPRATTSKRSPLSSSVSYPSNAKQSYRICEYAKSWDLCAILPPHQQTDKCHKSTAYHTHESWTTICTEYCSGAYGERGQAHINRES